MWRRYFISHSKILMSQWTLMSMSEEALVSLRYFSKYFMYSVIRCLSHVNSLSIFLFSSKTLILIWSTWGTDAVKGG